MVGIYIDGIGNQYLIDYSTRRQGQCAYAEFLKKMSEPFDEVSREHETRSWIFLYEAVRESDSQTRHLRN